MNFVQEKGNIFQFTGNLYNLPDNGLTLKDLGSESHIQLYRDALLSDDLEKDVYLVDLEEQYQQTRKLISSDELITRNALSGRLLMEQINGFLAVGQYPPPELILALSDGSTSVLKGDDKKSTMDRVFIPQTSRGQNSYISGQQKSYVYDNFKHILNRKILLKKHWDQNIETDRYIVAEEFLNEINDRRDPDTFLRGFDRYIAQNKNKKRQMSPFI